MARKKQTLQIPETYTVRRYGAILNERPAGMDFEEYKDLRRKQTKHLKARLSGFMVWRSKAMVATEKDGTLKPLGESWGTATRSMIPRLVFIG
jgi:hypothetical protein